MITQRDDSVTVSGAPMLAAAYHCVLLGIRTRRTDGLPCGDLQQLARALYRAHTSLQRQEVAPDSDTLARWGHQQSRDDWCTTDEAAKLVGLSRRSVQRMARAPGGLDAIRVGRSYLLGRRRCWYWQKGGHVTDGPTDYPDSWRPRGVSPSSPAPAEAIALAIDSYVASLGDQEFQALVERTRGRTP